ncbi:hypothetical protein [Xylanimonas sp. McL0601]|uniref:hypothetical protein n=1 Tax=Xylanimonas sp. McL0601 TaxID=3414739 RepID=UPI003CF6BD0E
MGAQQAVPLGGPQRAFGVARQRDGPDLDRVPRQLVLQRGERFRVVRVRQLDDAVARRDGRVASRSCKKDDCARAGCDMGFRRARRLPPLSLAVNGGDSSDRFDARHDLG